MLRRVLGNEEEAQDAYQETWFSLWRATLRLRWTREPWAFIRKTALRKAIDRMRRQGRSVVVETTDFAEPPRESNAADRPSFDFDVLGREERACLVLFFWDECSVQEIADLLEVPSGTVKTWMFRARAKLRRALERRESAHEHAAVEGGFGS